MTMLTHMQTARLSSANNLFAARDQLNACISRVCWQQGEAGIISGMIEDIDKLIAKLIPNKPAPHPLIGDAE